MILSSVETGNDTEAIRPFMENIHQTLSEFVSICPFEAARDVLTHYEVLQCSRSLVVLYSEEVLDRMMDLCRESQVTQEDDLDNICQGQGHRRCFPYTA
ncbi:uncharacterized protein LOC143900009 isoform X2 [Temnothorax americanus]|uniref:uncharacterized protein LOC143900009 isoform X2 n=1 Tax=Temnothorax americanus TaxID=1964332 RepID=UPI0040691E70